MPLKIYKLDASPPARAVMMLAELLKLKHEAVDVNLMTGDHLTPEYLKKNPQHTVPLLEDGDFYVADSHAINTYLASKYGGAQSAQLYPTDLQVRATIDSRLYFDISAIAGNSGAIVSALLRGDITSPTKEQTDKLNSAYEILDKFLQKTKFVAADHLTVADISLAASVSSASLLVPIDEKYSKLTAWFNTIQQEDWYKKANVPGLEGYKAFVQSKLK
uniref:Gst1 n=1 Tax=Spodoptera litura TaxID=69820 RepID=Q1EGY7_SPOLT|nr:gst1 [Spodoptera litura]